MSSTALRTVRIVAVLVLSALMLRMAWIGDDSLITLRTALNTTHGWGAGFNANEAVQGYTHPLWFLLWIGLGTLTGDWIIPILLLSIAFSSLAVFTILTRVSSSAVIVGVVGALALSNAFMEYTTSGLETPLSYLSVAILVVLSTRGDRLGMVGSVLGGLTTAAVILARFDLIVLIAIPLTLLVWKMRGEMKQLFAFIASALAPIFVWFIWSWVTYGVLLPNTFAAKQNSTIPRVEFLVQGMRYLWVSFERDPVSPLILLSGFIIAIVVRAKVLRAWMAGVALYLVYVMWIGGDFMVGRFLAVPVLVSAAVAGIGLSRYLTQTQERDSEGRSSVYAALGVLTSALILGAMNLTPTAVNPPKEPRWDYLGTAGVADEYGYHLLYSRDLRQVLMGLGRPLSAPPYQSADALNPAVTLSDVRSAANAWPDALPESSALPSAVIPQFGFLGTTGVMTGPSVHLVDQYALTDRFLARQTFGALPFQWRPGHFDRSVPEGYLDAIRTGDPNAIADPELREQLEVLWKQIRG